MSYKTPEDPSRHADRSTYKVMPIHEKEANTCDLVISCPDYRIYMGLTQFIAQHLQLAGCHDLFYMPGASLQFLLKRQSIVADIDLYVKMHGVTRITLIDHLGCGDVCDYLLRTKRCKDPADLENNERVLHTEFLRIAFRTIKEEFPQLSVKLYIYDESGTISEVHPAPPQILIIDSF